MNTISTLAFLRALGTSGNEALHRHVCTLVLDTIEQASRDTAANLPVPLNLLEGSSVIPGTPVGLVPVRITSRLGTEKPALRTIRVLRARGSFEGVTIVVDDAVDITITDAGTAVAIVVAPV
ncbi:MULTISPECIES: hypothetical protein [Methylobacterium]|uniref:Uncharacterized protein n=1 Tax=Methylobacterium brachiatum TaxID=269660 RepID=A0AAJ1TTD2_9HYPH|nr:MULTISPECIES: hypothetical protein [Methylobacterium]EIZ84320.1 hypothetical protein WYO_3201 [Methylobacterium sp. GXF4]MBP28083.1 hypothetical protein [Methylobacterium sp.]MDH2312540.1 hypothetical protein [Methylobacterium brachiatum]MDQ0546811.1 hypothetical protein [Methylobacterium brachiatum]